MFKLMLLLSTFFFACQSSQSNPKEKPIEQQQELSYVPAQVLAGNLSKGQTTNTDSTKIDLNYYRLTLLPSSKKYSQLKKEISSKQAQFLSNYAKYNNAAHQDSIIAQAANYITETLVNQIIPYWYGTPWDFSGYTDKPNDGQIGCSYFVSTTLVHAGFNLNRYKLAQQGPLSEAKSLVLQDSVLQLIGAENMLTTLLHQHPDGLFFIGLEHYHVGYLLKRKGEVFFLQSSYDESMAVIIEKAKYSGILNAYHTFYLVPITAQKELIRAWILKKVIPIQKGKE